MKTVNIKYLYYMVITLLAVIYVLLLFGMIELRYQELLSFNSTDIYQTVEQYNWKYWFEGENQQLTMFADFLRSVDIRFLHSNGMIPIIINLFFMVSTFFLIVKIIYALFDRDHLVLRTILIFISVVFLFSSLQDGSIIWRFDKQLAAAYFLPLFSYYTLIRYSQTKREIIFYSALIGGTFINFTTPYVFSALSVFFLLGLSIGISQFKKMLLLLPLLFALLLHYQEITALISTILGLFYDIKAIQSTFHYILSYFGSPFIYISYEPCFATSAIFSGLFMVATYLYVMYLWIAKKISEPVYMIMLAYWTFYILTAFSSLGMEYTYTAIFKNEFMMPSLIAWVLLVIFYVHFFRVNPIFQRRVLVVILTLTTILYGYQIQTYKEYKSGNIELKLGIGALKFSMYDRHFLKKLTPLVYVMRYRPEDKTDKTMSIFTIDDIKRKIIKKHHKYLQTMVPFNVSDRIENRSVSTTLNMDSRFKGALDKMVYIDQNNDLIKLTGWIYDLQKEQVPHVLLILNHDRVLIGFLLSDFPRIDIKNLYGFNALRSGFVGYIKESKIPKEIFLLDVSEDFLIRVEYKH